MKAYEDDAEDHAGAGSRPAGAQNGDMLMNALVLANFPIAALIFAAIVGIPLWLTFKRPDRAPQAPAAAQAAASQVAARHDVTPRAGAPRVSLARQHAAARTAVPGRQHAATARGPGAHDQAATRHDHAAP